MTDTPITPTTPNAAAPQQPIKYAFHPLSNKFPRMSDEEFTSQIKAHYDKELGVQRRLTAIERAKDDFTKLDLEEQVEKYVVDLQSEMDELIKANPQTLEERHQVFLLKKRIVDAVIVEARIDEDRAIHVKFHTDFLPHVR